MKITQKLFEISQTTYFSFTVEVEWKEYEWVLVGTMNSNDTHMHYDFWEWRGDEPRLTEEELDKLLEILLSFKL